MNNIQYKNGIPYVPVVFPFNEADGLLVEDIQLQKTIEYINKHNVKSIYICNIEDYNMLSKCREVEYLALELKVLKKYYSSLEKRGNKLYKKYDIGAIYELQKLKGLTIINKEEPHINTEIVVDVSKFSNLEKYAGSYKYIKKIEDAVNMRTLKISQYDKETLQELSKFKMLDTLELSFSKINSLKDIESLKKLKCLYLYYNKSLEDISSLRNVKKTLRALRIENCSKIKDFSVLEELENLELLELSGSNTIDNLGFLKYMKNLKTFVFNFNVLDGDLSLCLNLSYVYSEKNRKHYNLKDAELPKGEYVRGNESIEEWRRLE